MTPQKNTISCGGNLEVVKSWPSNFVSAIVTDPPYGLGFMGKDWDTFKPDFIEKSTEYYRTRKIVKPEVRKSRLSMISSAAAQAGSYDSSRNPEFQQWFTVWAKAMLRITKPGGFLLCFGGTRTYHRLACAIEDAGWEIRDCMAWFYGSGFPKSHNISKAIDKAKGQYVKGKVLPSSRTTGASETGIATTFREKTAANPQTDLVQLWDGYGTALKPAWEPIIVAMKPLDGTFAHNAEAHGVAGLNIDGGRIKGKVGFRSSGGFNSGKQSNVYGDSKGVKDSDYSQGRWPANLILDEKAAALLDQQTGTKKSGFMAAGTKRQMSDNPNKNTYGKFNPDTVRNNTYGDSGGASRFFKVLEPEPCFLCGYTEEHGNLDVGPGVHLCDECLLEGEALDLPKRFLYCSKTSRKERNMGMKDCEDKLLARSGGAQGAENRGEKEYLQKHIGLNRVAVVKNNHPTVKPLALMKYLCTLLKMPGQDQIILDPFLGSGTTGIACKELGINFIGIEKEREYCEIAIKRIAAVEGQEITLETTLPATKNVETPRATTDSAGGGRCPNESLPHVSESRQRIINAAAAALRNKRA